MTLIDYIESAKKNFFTYGILFCISLSGITYSINNEKEIKDKKLQSLESVIIKQDSKKEFNRRIFQGSVALSLISLAGFGLNYFKKYVE